jgi:tetratricopeptide (TPR) repeat protein
VRQAASADSDSMQLGLVELSIARSIKMQGGDPTDHLEAAGRIFEERGYLSGSFEVRSTLATLAFERGHHTRAHKQFRRLLELSEQMGFSQGTAVAQLGVFQSLVAMGEVDQAKVIVPVLLKLCKTPAALGSLGLSISAALQLVGESERSLQLVERTEKLFRQQRVKEMLSQALFVRGSCQAALGGWEAAKRAWMAAMKVDRELGHLNAELEKMVACSQAEIMIELTKHSSVSAIAAARIQKQLRTGAEKAISLGVVGVRLRGKIFQAEAQLQLVTKDPLGAVRSFGQAREEYHGLGLARDVAFVDAQVGIALLEISRSTHPNMIDEAIDSFRRALEYFNIEPIPAVRWKLHYYLAFSCLVAGNAKGNDSDLGQWREAARSWVRAANSDLEQVFEGNGGRSSGDADFAPGLSTKLLEELTKELSSNSDQVKKSTKSSREGRRPRSLKQLH